MALSATIRIPFAPALPNGVEDTLFTGDITALERMAAGDIPGDVNEGPVSEDEVIFDSAKFVNVVKPRDISPRSLARDAAKFLGDIPAGAELAAKVLAGGASFAGGATAGLFGGIASAALVGTEVIMSSAAGGPTDSKGLTPPQPSWDDLEIIEEIIDQARRLPSFSETFHNILWTQLFGRKQGAKPFWVEVKDPNDPLFVNAPAMTKARRISYNGVLFGSTAPSYQDHDVDVNHWGQASGVRVTGTSYVIDALALPYDRVPESARGGTDVLRNSVIKFFENAMDGKGEDLGRVDLELASEVLRKMMISAGILEDWSVRWWKRDQDRELTRNIIVAFAQAIFPQVEVEDKYIHIVGAK